jgi:microcystin-dependent protein
MNPLTRTPRLLPALIFTAALGSALPAQAQSEPLLGQIMCAGFNFAPRGWAQLDGQLLPINTNTALFSLLGTQYGGDGRTTFGLPDMRGRAVLHQGQGPGLTQRRIGERGGTESNTLTTGQLPAHTHSFAPLASSERGSTTSPSGAVPAAAKKATSRYAPGPGDTTMAEGTTGATGGNQSVDNMQPFVTVNCFIALQGVFPSRN